MLVSHCEALMYSPHRRTFPTTTQPMMMMMMGLIQIGIAAENAFAQESNSCIGQKVAAGIFSSQFSRGNRLLNCSIVSTQLHQISSIVATCNYNQLVCVVLRQRTIKFRFCSLVAVVLLHENLGEHHHLQHQHQRASLQKRRGSRQF